MKATQWAFRLAAAWAALGLLLIFVSPIVGLLVAVLHAVFAWGIRKRQKWAAVAWLIFLLLPIPFATQLRGAVTAQIVLGACLQLAMAVLVAKAALELRRTATASSLIWPWAAAVTGLLLFLVCVRPYTQPTGSMNPTILQGDYFFVQTRFLGAPHRGELVVFRNPANPRDIWIKRVVGVPGDGLRIVDKQLYRNGSAVVEPYVAHETSYIDSFRDNFPSEPPVTLQERALEMLSKDVRNGEVVVPPGQYFVLGDNRDNSLDSRYFGFVPATEIIGRPRLIYASYAVNSERAERTVFNTRWNRLFKVL
jgi:signal peptidase I